MKDPIYYYENSASLQIAGIGQFYRSITERTGIVPTEALMAGDRFLKTSDRKLEFDLWQLWSPLPDTEHWNKHLGWLWQTIRPHSKYFADILSHAKWSNLTLGCFSNCFSFDREVDPTALQIIRELPIAVRFVYTVGANA